MSNRRILRQIKEGPGIAAVARALGVSRQVAWSWFHRQIPAKHVAGVERITGIPRSELRPDIFPPERELLARRHKVLVAEERVP